MKKVLFTLVAFISILALPLTLKAAENIQTATLRDGRELVLNGIGKVKQLSDSFYIAALYLEEPFSSIENITYINSYKRMQIRIISRRVSARRFGQYWKESISINNPRNIWELQVKDVLAFTGFFKKTLKNGDVINLDYLPSMGTYVSINGVQMGRIKNPGFHNLLMMSWLGDRPPNELFKLGVMGGNDPKTALKLQQEFQLLQPSAERIKITKSWLAEDTTVEKKTNPTEKPVAKSKKKPTKKRIKTNKPKVKKAAPTVKTEPKTGKSPILKPKVADNSVDKKIKAKAVKKTITKVPAKKLVQQKPESKKQVVKVLSSSEKLKLYAARNSYERVLRKNIRKYQEYPTNRMLRNRTYKRQMERGQIESNGVLWVKIDRNGSVLSTKLEQSTGISILDKSAINMVEKADPLPKMPETLVGDDFEFLVQLKFLSPKL